MASKKADYYRKIAEDADKTWNQSNHAAAVVRTPDATGRERVDIHLIESLEHGPTKTHLSDYFTGFKGRLFLFRPAGLTPEIQTAFTNFLAALVASHVRYDYLGLLENIAGHTAEIPAGKEIHECICSAECGYAWERNGLPRKPDAPQHLVPQPPDLPVWWEADGPVIELLGPFR